MFFLARAIALFMSSTITVLPSKFNTICSYLLWYFTKSEATPITPSIPLCLIFSIFLPFTDVIGKNDALPKFPFLKNSINFLASSSVSVIIFWSAAPKHISIAVSYSFGVEIKFAKTPCIPFFKVAFFSHSISKFLTLFVYPSFSFSVSIKNLSLESFILVS